MKLLRGIVVIAILAYAAWIAIPGVQTFVTSYMAPPGVGAPPPELAAQDLAPAVEAAPQADATATAVAEGSIPRIGLWAAAVGLYLVAALLFAGDNPRAFVAYLVAFGADVALMMLSRPEFAVDARTHMVEAIPDLRAAVIIGLGVVGLLILVLAGRGTRRARHA